MKKSVLEYIKSRQPIVIAHRGASGSAPENTLAAFKMAKDAGADGIELDVHLSASGDLVVIHDYELNRTARKTNGDPLDLIINVEDLTLGRLRQYDFGISFSKKYAGEKIPTLREAMDLIGPEILLDIEIKANKGKPYKELSVALARFLFDYSRKKSINNVFVSSFNPFALNVFRKESRKLKMEISTALIYANNSEVPAVLRFGQGRLIHDPDILKPWDRNLTNRKDLSGGGFMKRKPVLAWTVDDPNTAKDLFNRHIAGVITNFPEKILKVR